MRTFREVRKFRPVVLFLLAYWMYIDGVNTIMKMAVDYGLALGFPADSLIAGILMIQFIGFPATLLFGWLGDRISPLVGIFVGIARVLRGDVLRGVHDARHASSTSWLRRSAACRARSRR